MKSSQQTLTESSLILIISTALTKIIGALFKIPLAGESFLGDVGFGYYSVAHDLYSPFYTLAISGLPVAVSHIIAEKISKNQKADAYSAFISCKKLFVFCGILFSALLTLLAIPALLISKNGIYSSYSVFVIVPSVFLCFIISVYRGYFEGFSNMYPTAISKVIEALCKLILGLCLSFGVLKLTNNIALAAAAAMFAVTVGTALSTLYLYLKHKHNNPLDIKLLQNNKKAENDDLKVFVKISAPFVMASLAASLVAFLDIFTVKLPIDAANSNYLNVVFAQNGYISGDVSAYLYGVRSKAYTVYNIIPTFTVSLGVAALPVLTGLFAKDDKKSLSKNVIYSTKLICTVTFPVAIGLFALSGRVMELLYSSSTHLDNNLLRLYALTGLFAGISIPLTTVLQAVGKHKKAVTHIFIGILLKIILSLSLVFIPQINIYAAPIGTLACYVYIAVSIILGICKAVPSDDYFSAILKPLISSVFCGISAYLIASLSSKIVFTIIAIIVGGLVYFGFILITKVFKKSDIMAFPIINRIIRHK